MPKLVHPDKVRCLKLKCLYVNYKDSINKEYKLHFYEDVKATQAQTAESKRLLKVMTAHARQCTSLYCSGLYKKYQKGNQKEVVTKPRRKPKCSKLMPLYKKYYSYPDTGTDLPHIENKETDKLLDMIVLHVYVCEHPECKELNELFKRSK